MNIRIHRSSMHKNVITEISTLKTKILLDCGVNLEENEVLVLPELQLRYQFSGINAVFISQYNTDHITMTRGLLDNVPVYTGKLASKIALSAEKYKAKKPFEFADFYENGVSIIIGDIKITPYQIDEDIVDGYLLLIEGDGKSVLYTGDFRANGRKSFEDMVKGLPPRVDILLCGGSFISKEDINLVTERDIEEQAAEIIGNKKGPVFVLQGLTDFDRATTMFQTAKRNKRVFLEDLYMAQIAISAEKAMPNPSSWIGTRAFLTTGYKEEHFRYKMFTEQPRLSKSEIGTQKFVMCIRTSMKKYIKTLSQALNFKDGIIINTLPEETWKTTATEEFLAFAQEKKLEVVTLRNSGHADAMALKVLIKAVKPKRILPLSIQNIKPLTKDYPQIIVVASADIKC